MTRLRILYVNPEAQSIRVGPIDVEWGAIDLTRGPLATLCGPMGRVM